MTMASTPWLMKLRTAAICAAGSLSAALNTSSKPFSFENASFMDFVFAARQPDSEPVCAKPTLMVLDAAAPPLVAPASPGADEPPPQPVTARASAARVAIPDKSFTFIVQPPGLAGFPAGLPSSERVAISPMPEC